jgi:hypothetical protein
MHAAGLEAEWGRLQGRGGLRIEAAPLRQRWTHAVVVAEIQSRLIRLKRLIVVECNLRRERLKDGLIHGNLAVHLGRSRPRRRQASWPRAARGLTPSPDAIDDPGAANMLWMGPACVKGTYDELTWWLKSAMLSSSMIRGRGRQPSTSRTGCESSSTCWLGSFCTPTGTIIHQACVGCESGLAALSAALYWAANIRRSAMAAAPPSLPRPRPGPPNTCSGRSLGAEACRWHPRLLCWSLPLQLRSDRRRASALSCCCEAECAGLRFASKSSMGQAASPRA